MAGQKPCQSHSLMGYPATTGITCRKINLDFATDKTVNQENPKLGGVRELIELYGSMVGHVGEGGAEKSEGWG